MTPDEREKRTAHHEAAHAAVAIAFGLMPDSATVIAADGYLGCVTSPHPVYGYEGVTARDRARRARDEIVALFAGLAAEHVFFGVPFTWEEGADHGAWKDYNDAWRLLCDEVRVRGARFVGDEAYDRALARLQREALIMVRRYRAEIDSVARALHENGSLSGAAIRDILMGTAV